MTGIAPPPGAMPSDLAEELRDFHRRWATIRPPLRPDAGVAATVAALLDAVGARDDARPTLLLGVTPELAAVPRHLVAVDWSRAMVDAAWPGSAPQRHVVIGDWKRMPLAEASVAAAIGDGIVSMLSLPMEQPLLFAQLRRVIRPGGRIVLRCFATPDPCERVATVRDAAFAGGLDFHAFKQRFNMAISVADGLPNISSAHLFARFEALFPDRMALAQASGWSLATIAEFDAYRGSRYVHCYPSRDAVLALVPGWAQAPHFVETSGYPLAERCPLLVIDLP
ncbi:class I SAM-dependent methyltransferase [Sphingomonas sanxanigenens]|uniref:Methyltransferase type 11 domain-containing protein n=1 Tax=Sphingomonas sanxanigenens DSM 19645 = NX02 TaxID=1123269 RepID=W0AL21_9SPHN|nr:methyltransferase domain-containing protein [Sphingomonas sanxanigenens]AHE57287.1 hypothetical protein NX02_28530 [Sphingomonas sanxanigenens DSM 19645 = NX02]